MGKYKVDFDNSTITVMPEGYDGPITSSTVSVEWPGDYLQPEPKHDGACPKCGYCKHCGRGGHYPVYPVYPYYPTMPPYYIGDPPGWFGGPWASTIT